MLTVKKALSSSVGRKFIMALSGIGLMIFVTLHLLGNLSLFLPSGMAFNRYAHGLESLGAMLIVAEVGLVAVFVAHIIMGFRLKKENLGARPVRYQLAQSKEGPSKSSMASRNMILTGSLLLIFLILHIKQFKFGPGIAEGYVTQIDGQEVRDLHRLVVESFQSPLTVGIYVVAMLMLLFHLRHGFWSAFQSLGVANKRNTAFLYCKALAFALIIGIGFLGIPLWIYWRGN